MSTDEFVEEVHQVPQKAEEPKHKDGKPWKVIATYETFQEADDHRHRLRRDKRQAKVRRRVRGGKKVFQVRTR